MSASSCSTVGSAVTSWTLSTSISRYSCLAACSTATSSPSSVMVMRLMSGWSVWLTASDSMLKLRARMRRRDAVEDARPVEDDRDEDVTVRSPLPGQCPGRRSRVGRAGRPASRPGRGRRPRRHLAVGARVGRHSSGSSPHVSMRSDRPLPAGIIGKTFCVSAISNQTSAGPSMRLGGPDRVVDLVGSRGLPGGDAERLGELQVVGPEQVGRVVVARVDDLLPLADHPELLVVEQRDLDRDLVLDERHQLLERHLEAAVAGDRPGLLVGPAERRAHGRPATGSPSCRGRRSRRGEFGRRKPA